MRFYLVTLDAAGLGLGDGIAGFIAVRFVYTSSPRKAEERAKALTSKRWPDKPLTFEILSVEPVGTLRALLSRRTNRSHIFYPSEDEDAPQPSLNA